MAMDHSVLKRKPGSKPGTEAARTAFLFGTGNGERVLDTKQLAKIGGISTETVNNRLPEWEAEFRQLASGSGFTGFQLNLSADLLETAQRNLQSWRELDTALLAEIQALPKIEKFLRGAVDWIKENGDKGDVQDMKDMVDTFIRVSNSRKSLIRQRLDVNARFNKLSGLDDLMDVASARAKAMETGRARIELEKERAAAGMGPDLPDAKPVPPQLRGRFAAKVQVEDDGLGGL